MLLRQVKKDYVLVSFGNVSFFVVFFFFQCKTSYKIFKLNI